MTHVVSLRLRAELGRKAWLRTKTTLSDKLETGLIHQTDGEDAAFVPHHTGILPPHNWHIVGWMLVRALGLR